MKILLDECMPQRFRAHVVGHDVFTTGYMGWAGIKNGALLALAANDGFDALVTTDKNIQFQQNVTALPIAVVVLDAVGNDIPSLLPLVPPLLAVLANLPPRTVTHVR